MDRPAPRFEVVPRRTLRTERQRKRYEKALKGAKRAARSTPRQDFGQWVELGKERDDLLGLTRKFYFNPDTQQYGIETIPDVAALTAQNEREFNATLNAPLGRGKDLVKVASLPMNLLFQDTAWRAAYRERDDAWLKRKLNDPDWQKLRTHKGAL